MSASTARQAVPAVTRRSYVALNAFHTALYSYSYGLNEELLREVGTLTLNPAANSGNCPKGAILHENGRKLNPADIYFRGANDGASMFMVGVYDPQSGLNGFINPNSPLFGLQNSDKPIYLNESEPLGNGILTNGTIETTQSVTAGTSVVAGTSVTAGTSVVAGTYLASRQVNVPLYNTGGTAVAYNPINISADVFIDYTAGNVFVITAPSGSSLTNIYVYFNPNPLVPGNVPVQNGVVLTLIFVNGANRIVNVNFSGPIVKRTSNTLALPDGDPNPTISNIMFASANGVIIELNRSGSMAL
jgi:hypothetical protein